MHKLFSIIIFGGLLVLFPNCKSHCRDEDVNKGIIVNSELFTNRTPPVNGSVISDSTAFHQMFPRDSLTIDFNSYSLLGLFVEGSGCDWSIIRNVTRIDHKRQYHYKVTAYTCGSCKAFFSEDNWVTVPKLPSGWTVTFEKKIK